MYGAYSEPHGPQAARLRKRKADLRKLFPVPDDLLPGSLSESHMRCGKPGCHCAQSGDPGHSFWTLTFMVRAKKRTLHIPKDLVDEVRQRVEAGRVFQDAVREILAANAELLALAQQHRPKRKRK
jgi:hypothetical protein